MTAECIRCTRPMADVAYCCPSCMAVAAQNLALVTEYTPAARDVAQGLSRRSAGGGSGKPGSRLPLDLGATAKLDAVANALGTWVRVVVEERGVYPERVPPGADTIPAAARFLGEHLEWIRHQQFADEALTDVGAAVRVMRSVARGPADKRFLGVCGATITWDDQGDEVPLDQPCAGYVFGTGKVGVCGECKAQWDDVAQRLARLDTQVRERLFTAKDICDAYGLNVKIVRGWHNRGRLVAHGHDAHGAPLHKVGEVLDLAAGDAARREEARATRARRTAAKAATTEGEAA